jgi:hypothetical protein
MKKRKWFDVRMPHSFFYFYFFLSGSDKLSINRCCLNTGTLPIVAFAVHDPRSMVYLSLSLNKNWCRRSACDSMRPFAPAQSHRWSSLFIRMRETLLLQFATLQPTFKMNNEKGTQRINSTRHRKSFLFVDWIQ